MDRNAMDTEEFAQDQLKKNGQRPSSDPAGGKAGANPGNTRGDPDTFAGLLFSLTSSWGRLFRAIVGLALLSVILCFAVVLIIKTVAWFRPPFSFTVTDKGALVLSSSKDTAIFALSPNGTANTTPWVDTGVQVKEKQEFKIKASGSVCLAIHRLVLKQASMA
jgi:hypothetical protein